MSTTPNIPFIQAAPGTFEKGRLGGYNGIKHDGTIQNIIIHTVDGSLQSAVNTFQSGARGVSAHYIVGTDGHITQMVLDTDTAYHCGNYKMNLMSIGIEHADDGNPYDVRPDILYRKSGILVAYLCSKYGLQINRQVLRLHKEVSLKATACPATLDVDKIIEYALRAYSGEALLKAQETTEASYHRTVTITLDQGVNVRTTPTLEGKVITALPKGTKVNVEQVIQGANVTGNNLWYKLQGQERYIWSGGTNVPNPPQSITAPAPLVPDLKPADQMSVGELQDKYDEARDAVIKITQTNTELLKINEDLKKELEIEKRKVTNYETETANVEVIRRANESLSTQVTEYQNKISELKRKLGLSYVEAFNGWTLIEIPKGTTAMARIPIIAIQLWGLIVSVVNHDYVIGWKKDSRLTSVSEYQSMYGEVPQGP